MKTIVALKQSSAKILLLFVLIACAFHSEAQNLKFTNWTHESGSPAAGTNGSIYRFASVTTNVDALVKINARSSSLVTLTTIDVTNTGYDLAFQPQVAYNGGSTSSAGSWWMEFKISFVHKNTNVAVSLSNVYASAIDLDGDNNRLHETASFLSPATYTLENPTNILVTNINQLLLGILTNVGKNFDGVTTDHNGIDTLATNLMVTAQFTNINSITYRAGGSTTGASSNTDRQYSVYFKNFNYSAPIIQLPVTLIAFNANLKDNKTNLTWTTAQEMNVNHFEIEKSYDGKSFSNAGIVAAYGNSFDKRSYSFTDNLSNNEPEIIYYRLRSVDFDGKSALSETKIIRISKQAELVNIATYPNPATNELRVTIPANWQNKEVTLAVFNSNGQPIKIIKDANASQTQVLNITGLATGFYFLKASCGTDLAQQKFIKN